MKYVTVCVLCTVALLVVSGCTNNPTAFDHDIGELTVTVPVPAESSRGVDLAFAQANTNIFEVVIYNTETRNTYADIIRIADGNATTFRVPPAQYDIAVLAGHEIPPSAAHHILGTGYSTVLVEPDAIAEVTVDLHPIQIGGFSVDSEAVFGTTVNVYFEGGTLGVPQVTAKFSVILDSAEVNTGVYFDVGDSQPQTQQSHVPLALGTYNVRVFEGGGLRFQFSNGSVLGGNALDGNWYFPIPERGFSMPDYEYQQTVDVVSTFSGVDITVGWYTP